MAFGHLFQTQGERLVYQVNDVRWQVACPAELLKIFTTCPGAFMSVMMLGNYFRAHAWKADMFPVHAAAVLRSYQEHEVVRTYCQEFLDLRALAAKDSARAGSTVRRKRAPEFADILRPCYACTGPGALFYMEVYYVSSRFCWEGLFRMATAVNPHQDSDAGYLQGFRIGGANSNLEFFRDADTGMLCARCHVNRHKTTDRQALVSAAGSHAGESTAQALATVTLQGMSTAQDTPWDDPSSGDDQRQRPDCVVVLLVQLVSRTIGLATSVPAGGFPCNGVPAGRAGSTPSCGHMCSLPPPHDVSVVRVGVWQTAEAPGECAFCFVVMCPAPPRIVRLSLVAGCVQWEMVPSPGCPCEWSLVVRGMSGDTSHFYIETPGSGALGLAQALPRRGSGVELHLGGSAAAWPPAYAPLPAQSLGMAAEQNVVCRDPFEAAVETAPAGRWARASNVAQLPGSCLSHMAHIAAFLQATLDEDSP